MIANDCPPSPNNFSPNDHRTFVHRQARKWRFLSLGGGLLLAASFFMPAVQGCNSPTIPAEEWYKMFSRGTFTFSELIQIFYLFGAAYLIGLLLALGAWTRLKGPSILEKNCSFALSALLIFIAGGGITLYLYEFAVHGLPSAISEQVISTIFITVCATSIIYVFFTFRLDRTAHICRAYLAGLIVFVWFGSWFFACLYGGALIGLFFSFFAACALLLATIAEAKVMARQSVWRTILQLMFCRLVYRTDLQRRCPGCDYDLFGLTEMRCPECGRSFTFEELGTTPVALGFMDEIG